MSNKPRIVCIVGATASGKTDVSIKLAQRLNTEIISADSIQVYKGLDIGSAKPTIEERQGIVHHLLDCIDIDKKGYSVSEYKELASDIIYDMQSRGKLPIVVGGTGLYINALTYPLSFTGVKADEEIRERLRSIEEKEHGALHKMLQKVDEKTASRLHENDTKRIIRALEVYEVSGKPLSEHDSDFKNERGQDTEFEPIMIGITMPRDMLYKRIEKRVDLMMQEGLVDETKSIMQMSGFRRDLPAVQGLGYRQVIEHLLDKAPETIEETVDKIKLETRHFAKRQLTWFRRDMRINWIDTEKYASKDAVADRIYDLIKETDR